MNNLILMLMMEHSSWFTMIGEITLALFSSILTSQKIGLVSDSSLNGPSQTQLVYQLRTHQNSFKITQETLNSSWDQHKTPKLCSRWPKQVDVFLSIQENIQFIHSLNNCNTHKWQSSNANRTWIILNPSTKTHLNSCHQLREKEKTLEDAYCKRASLMSSSAPPSSKIGEVTSTCQFTLTRISEMSKSREFSIPWISRPTSRNRFYLTLSQRKPKSSRIRLHFGKFT